MEANNVPEKIYLATTEEVQNLDTSFVGIAHSDPHDIVNPVEYTHKEAFIEKACDWLRIELVNFEDYIGMGETFIEDFKKYMKGE